MTLEKEIKNIKGRIREAVYAGKQIHILDNWHSFVLRRAGTKSSYTNYFISYISACRFFIYCRPNIPTDKFLHTVSELERHVQEVRGFHL